MSSSDNMFTFSSSESTESERSKDRRLGDEGTSSVVGTSGMSMEVMREVREDPPKSWTRATGRRKAATGGWLVMFVISRLCSGGPAY